MCGIGEDGLEVLTDVYHTTISVIALGKTLLEMLDAFQCSNIKDC